MSPESRRVLIVEDNEDLAEGLRRSLEAAGFHAAVAHDAGEARRSVDGVVPDLVVLDLMLPETDGFELLRDFRASGQLFPVLILSARGEEIDKLRGFRMGADDYVVKPVGVLELIARVEAILRRAEPTSGDPSGPAVVSFGDVAVDRGRRIVMRAGETVPLTPREFDLLACLLSHHGRAVSRETLLEEAWGYKHPVPTRTIDTHVASLRAKLEDDAAQPTYIHTVRKVGYRVEMDDHSTRAG